MPSQEMRNALQEQMLKECQAMAKYAFSTGLNVPWRTVQLLETLRIVKSGDAPSAQADDMAAARAPDAEKGFGTLALIHGQLCKVIAPAKPGTILLLSTENRKQSIFHFLGPVPLVRNMMVLAIFSLLLLILISTAESVTGKIDWANQHGSELLLNELFIVTAAAIGASFAALFNAHKYIAAGTYDPKYDYSYWIRLVLGLIAGTILALLIPLEDTVGHMTKPTLGMLGGFSVTVVYRILNRLVVTVETLVHGDARDMVSSQLNSQKAKSEEENAQNKLKLATRLMSLKEQLGPDMDQDMLKQKLNQLLEEMLPPDQEGVEISK